MPVGGYVAAPELEVEPPVVEEPNLQAAVEPEVEAPVTEEPKIEIEETPVAEAPAAPTDPLAGVSPTSTKVALVAKAEELGLVVPDGAKRSDVWNLLKAHVNS
jgi:hypothetical protein